MVKRFLLFLLAIILAACSKDYCAPYPCQGEQDITLSASLEQQQSPLTKTSLTATNAVVWSADDVISVLSYGTKANNDRFVLETGAATSSATFRGMNLSTASKYYALYPYSSTVTYDGTGISFNLPDTQTYVAGSFGNGANPAVAAFTGTGDDLQFKNVCGVLSIYLSGSGNLESIKLTSKKSGENLWGDYTLTADANIGTDSQTLSYTANGGNSVTLDCGSGVTITAEAKEFDIVVPPGTLSEGFDALCTFTGGQTETISSTKDQSIVRSQKHIMAGKAVTARTCTNLENDMVKAYLDYVEANPYTDGDLTVSYISNFYNQSTSYRKDRPSPVTISWNKKDNSTAQYLTVSLSSDFSNPYYNNEEISNTVSTYDIYDLIPGKMYYYKVTATVGGDTQTLISSDFTTCGRRRMLYIDNTFNVRDLGGIRTADGHAIKFGKIFRGGRPNENNSTTAKVTDAGRRAAKRAGVLVDLDLRTDSESGNLTTSPFNIADEYTVEYKRFPTASSGWYGSINTSAGVVNINELQYVIDKLRENKPVYFHCSIGADRTGTLACLIEGLLGVRESQFSIDYELTSFSEAGLRKRTEGGTFSMYPLYNAIITVPDEINGVTYPASVTTSLQRRFYNYYYRGIDGTSISQTDLDWFIDYMLE